MDQQSYIFGTRAAIEALHSGKEIEKILVGKETKNELIKELVQLCHQHKVPVQQVPLAKLNKISRKNHQGVISFVSPVQFSSIEGIVENCYGQGKDPFVVMLDRVTDIRNFGAICRTLECAGADAVIIPSKGNAAINADAVKTSAGALHYLPVCRSMNLKETIQYLKECGLSIVACTEKAEMELYDANLAGPVCVILGSEEDGISEAYLKMSDERVKIPMFGNIESLNVSVSTGVMVYEIVRQRKK